MGRTGLRWVPGIGLLVAIGLLARGAAGVVPVVNHLIIAVLLGAILTNVYGVPSWASAGVGQHKLLLEAGIVLMGARLALAAVVDAGPKILLLILMTVGFTLVFVEAMSQNVFGLSEKIGSLVAAGAGICGVSAIVAVAGSINAEEDQIAYAVGTILLFDALTLLTFPLLGGFLGLSDVVFGIWAGVSMFSTGPVTAAGFAYSDTAGQWATLTKLTRNLLISVAVIGYSVYYAQKDVSTGSTPPSIRLFWDEFPKFVIGFVAMMMIASFGFLSDQQVLSLKNGYQWLFLFAFAGLGMNITLDEMRETGIRPVMLLLTTLVVVSSLALVAVTMLFGA